MELQTIQSLRDNALPLDVSIVMPCLNEAQSLPHCIANAHKALDLIRQFYGFAGEVVIADNGSTDGSQAIATALGARVIRVQRKGYGAALIGGFNVAYGRYLIMGDCDGSYDFVEAVPMIERLIHGADLCMGSRFKGGIAPGAMPWKNRYIGNPVLTGMLNLFFRSGIDDAHCGLRAICKESYARLGLTSEGMEFASEMVIKASLLGFAIRQVPATLSPDLRDRPPHLRPWRDGWRHLRYLFMLSPTWAFGVPALLAMLLAGVIIGGAALHQSGLVPGKGYFGESWVIVGGFLAVLGHLALIMALATHLHGVNQGYRKMRPLLKKYGSVLTLESALVAGLALIAVSGIGFGLTGYGWAHAGYAAMPSVLPVTLAAVIAGIGCQSLMGGFLLAIISGHKAQICPSEPVFAQDIEQRAPISNFTHAVRHAPTPRPHNAQRVGRYTAVSAICLAIQNFVLISSAHFGLHYALAVLASTAVLIPIGFALQSRVTFGAGRDWRAFARYAGAMASNLPMSFALAWVLCGKLGLPMLIASPTISVCLFGWNYLSSGWALARPARGLSQAS